MKNPLKIFVLAAAIMYIAVLFLPPLLYQRLTLPPDPYTSIVNTALAASIASLLAFPLAVLLGFYVSARGLAVVLPFLMFATAIPHTAIGLMVLPLFLALNIVDTWLAVIITMMIVSLPLGVGSVASGLSATVKALDEFLSVLGVGELRNIWIHMRAMGLGWAVSFMLMWLRAFSELGALLIVSYRPSTVGVYMFELFQTGGAEAAVPYAIIVATLGMVFSGLLYIISWRGG
jgi:ABC-type sulfate transport system permease component